VYVTGTGNKKNEKENLRIFVGFVFILSVLKVHLIYETFLFSFTFSNIFSIAYKKTTTTKSRVIINFKSQDGWMMNIIFF
jgi:hypothetical protein